MLGTVIVIISAEMIFWYRIAAFF